MMKDKWSIECVNQAAEEELLRLSPDLKSKFLHISELLLNFGPFNVGLPYTKSLGNKFWEIRIKGKNNIPRSIYVVSTRRRIIILHTFIKKTQKIPMKSLQVAKTR